MKKFYTLLMTALFVAFPLSHNVSGQSPNQFSYQAVVRNASGELVKNTTIGNGSKVNHLTYIGDASIGTESNIGAGSITCNYNGVNKFKTVIGDQVRIGSGTMMVAPVNIGDKATTGAGSVITKDCPAGQLTIGRARQVSIDKWQRPEKDSK